LIGGAGWYNAAITVTGFGSGSDNHFGWDLGGGVKMPLSGFDTFLEARYNQVQGNGGSLKFHSDHVRSDVLRVITRASEKGAGEGEQLSPAFACSPVTGA